YILHLFLERSAYHLDLNSFPTRRSSDLIPKKQLDLYLKVPIVKTIVKNKILKGLGLNQCKIVATGAAITPAFLKEFYKKLDIHLDRKSTRLNSSHVKISYAVFCLKKKKK